jgi:hypothetical protein
LGLATLAQVKAKLRIPVSDTLDDVALQGALDSAESYVLAETGYSLEALNAQDIFTNVQPCRILRLSKRPVDNVTAEARALGEDSWHAVDVAIVGADVGLVALLGQQQLASWASWRDLTYDLVRISYTVVALNPVPAELVDAAAELAAYWFQLQLAGPAKDSAAGPARQSVALEMPVPATVRAALARHVRERAIWV